MKIKRACNSSVIGSAMGRGGFSLPYPLETDGVMRVLKNLLSLSMTSMNRKDDTDFSLSSSRLNGFEVI